MPAGEVDRAWVRRWLPLGLAVSKLFRARILGLDTLPKDRPFLLVANHSGGLGLAELTCLASIYLENSSYENKLAGVAHHLGFRVPGLAHVHARLGSVPSTHDACQRALSQGVPLLVFPGGDHESFRPLWQAGRVDFGGRMGYARLAIEAGVPVVPMGIVGGAWTAPMLWRSTWLLPRLLVWPWLAGLKRWPLSLLGLIGAVGIATMTSLGHWRWPLMWAWLASPLPLTPWIPARLTMRVGGPIEPGSDARAFADRVEGELQRLVSLSH